MSLAQAMANVKHSNILLMLLSTASVGLSLVLQFACVLVLGAGSLTDAYFSAQTVPLLASAILIGALTNNLTPMAAGLDNARRIALIRAAMLKFAALAIVLFGTLAITAKWWIPTLFPRMIRFSGELTTELTGIFCAIAVVQILSAIGAAGHYARGQFLFVETVQILTTLLSLVFVSSVIEAAGILGFGWLLLVRATGAFVISSACYVVPNHAPVKELSATLWERTAHVMSASIVFKMGPLIDRMVASFSIPGVLTSLGIGQQLVGSTLTITERVIARPLLAAAGAHSLNEGQKILSIYYCQLRILLSATGIALLVAVPLGMAALQGNKLFSFANKNIFGQLDLIFLMALTIIPAAAGQLSSALMYALGDIKSINRLAMVSFILSSALKVFGFLLVGAYAIVAGIFLYQSMNWLFLHLVAVRTLRMSRI
jgi:peptidoglycan biosynthesis protein MviN/MurJ (putative lipid II flippase)